MWTVLYVLIAIAATLAVRDVPGARRRVLTSLRLGHVRHGPDLDDRHPELAKHAADGDRFHPSPLPIYTEQIALMSL